MDPRSDTAQETPAQKAARLDTAAKKLKIQVDQALIEIKAKVIAFDQAKTEMKNISPGATPEQIKAAQEKEEAALNALEEAKMAAMMLSDHAFQAHAEAERAAVAMETKKESLDDLDLDNIGLDFIEETKQDFSRQANLMASTAILNARVSTHEQELSQLSDRVNSLESNVPSTTPNTTPSASTTPAATPTAPAGLFSRMWNTGINAVIDLAVKTEQMIFKPNDKTTASKASTTTTATDSSPTVSTPSTSKPSTTPSTQPSNLYFSIDTINGSMPQIKIALKENKGLDAVNIFLTPEQKIVPGKTETSFDTFNLLKNVERKLARSGDTDTLINFQRACRDGGLEKVVNQPAAPVTPVNPSTANSQPSTPSAGLATVRDQKPFFVSGAMRVARIYCHLDKELSKTDQQALKMQAAAADHRIGFHTAKNGNKLMFIEPAIKVAGKAEQQIRAMETLLNKVTQGRDGSKPPANFDALIARAKTHINSKFLQAQSVQNKAPGIYQMNIKILVGGKPQSLNPTQQMALSKKLQDKLDKKMASKDDKGVTYAEKQGSRANPQVKFINDKGQTRLQVNFDPKMDKKEQKVILQSLVKASNNKSSLDQKAAAKKETENRKGPSL